MESFQILREGIRKMLKIKQIKQILNKLADCEELKLNLLRINVSQSVGVSYLAREIQLYPEGTINEFVMDIVQKYTNESKGELNKFTDVVEYDGTAEATHIYYLDGKGDLIGKEFSELICGLAQANQEENVFDFSPQAYVIQGVVTIDGKEKSIKLISMQCPFTMLKNKFMKGEGGFKQINEKVLSLRPYFDVIIVERDIYFLSMAGERLFDMERAYKSICTNRIQGIIDCDIINDVDSFTLIAGSGHNPRRFVSFNQKRLNDLKNPALRKTMSKLFQIPMKDGKYDTSDERLAERLVKVLCNKGMVDPFEEAPVEVSGSKNWS